MTEISLTSCECSTPIGPFVYISVVARTSARNDLFFLLQRPVIKLYLGRRSCSKWNYNSTKPTMNEPASKANGSYIHNTIANLKNKVFSPNIQASLNSNMAAPPRNLDMVKLDARVVAMDIVHYISEFQVLPPQSEHCTTMRRTTDELTEKHRIVFNSIIRRLDFPTQQQDGIVQKIRHDIFAVADEMLNDRKMNWGRLISLYAFGGMIAKHFADSGLTAYVDVCGQCIGDYASERLAMWMHSEGGWVGI